jgi:hypothetical protein
VEKAIHGLFPHSWAQASDRDDGDTVAAHVSESIARDYGKHGRLAALLRVDPFGESPQRFACLVNRGLPHLHLEGAPPTIASFHDRIDFQSVVVAVMKNIGIGGLGVHPQITNHERLE